MALGYHINSIFYCITSDWILLSKAKILHKEWTISSKFSCSNFCWNKALYMSIYYTQSDFSKQLLAFDKKQPMIYTLGNHQRTTRVSITNIFTRLWVSSTNNIGTYIFNILNMSCSLTFCIGHQWYLNIIQMVCWMCPQIILFPWFFFSPSTSKGHLSLHRMLRKF